MVGIFFKNYAIHVDILYNQVQARGIDASKALKAVQPFKPNIQSTRNASLKQHVPKQANINRPCYNKERIVAAKYICDVILLQFEERFTFAGHLEASLLFDSDCFHQY